MFRKRTGNWFDDLGDDIQTVLWWGLACLVIVPALVIAVIVLAVTR